MSKPLFLRLCDDYPTKNRQEFGAWSALGLACIERRKRSGEIMERRSEGMVLLKCATYRLQRLGNLDLARKVDPASEDAPVLRPHAENVALMQQCVEWGRASDVDPLTDLQRKILAALDGRAMKVEALADYCKINSSRLYKPGGITELKRDDRVCHKRQLGYFRPDRPPK